MIDKREKGTVNSDAMASFADQIWNDLDRNIWPDALAPIKPSKWDAMEPSLKGKAVLENLGNIIYHVFLLTDQALTDQARQLHSPPGNATRHKIDYIADNILSTGHLYP